MEIKKLTPRHGDGTYRIDESDDLVVIEDIDWEGIPSGRFYTENHRIGLVCTAGRAQFEYDGVKYTLEKNDLFLYMRHNIISNFMASSDFNCRQIWFTRSEIWNLNIYSNTNLMDMVYLKQHPKVHLTNDDISLIDSYFQLLFRRMKDRSAILYPDIVRSLVGTMMLEMLSMMRREEMKKRELSINGVEQDFQEGNSSGVHRRRLADKFMRMAEQSDGRIRKVDEFASQLNITPKYLSAILKETMNCRPSTVIQLFTMKAIEHRLRFTDMTIQEISIDLNFPNPSFFGKYFKEHAGMTPLEYRNKYHKRNNQ
jgi:AraC-like DNA-binding protein